MKKINLENSYNLIIDKIQDWYEALVVMLPNLLLCIVLLVLFYFVATLAKKIVRKGLLKFVDNRALISLIETITFFVVICIGLFVGLSILKLDKAVTSLLAGAGVIGLALSFAFQDSATNFISGVFMAIRKPIRINDVIKISDEMGVVEEINLRSTLLRSLDGQKIIVPNKQVYQNKVTNYTTYPKRRVQIDCGVTYDANLEEVKQIGEDAIASLDFIDNEKGVQLYFNEFGGSSINFTLYFWIIVNDEPNFLQARNAAMISLKKAFDANDIGIPFPIRTLEFDGESMTKILDKTINSK